MIVVRYLLLGVGCQLPAVGNRLSVGVLQQGFEIGLEALEYLLLAEVLHGVGSGGAAEAEAENFVLDELGRGGEEGGGVLCWDDQAAAFDDLGDLGAGFGGCDHGTAAGEHSSEAGGHDQVGGACALGEQVNVGGVEEMVEAVEQL